MKEVKLAECGLSYAVVAIMGPQSSGMQFGFQKPTLCIIVHSVACLNISVIIVYFLACVNFLDDYFLNTLLNFCRKEYIVESPVWYKF